MSARAPLQFSLFFFAASPEDAPSDLYRLMRETAKFADANGFTAIWTPERHFQNFGGLYPNPSVTSAALAMITSRIKLRAGSVVAPLQNVLRIAEEWAVVDNLSGGRVGLSLASGWHPDDFVLNPTIYPTRREDLAAKMETLKKLWSGEKITLPNGEGKETLVGILPRPIQKQLELWLTCQQDGSFSFAGEAGLHALTNLNYKKHEDLDRKARLYHDASIKVRGQRGHFTLMAHTFVGTDEDHVWNVAGKSLQRYLETRVEMDAKMIEGLEMSDEERAFLARRGTEQFLGDTSMIGTIETCGARAARFHASGVDEIACLIDFGVPFDEVMASLERLLVVKAAVGA